MKWRIPGVLAALLILGGPAAAQSESGDVPVSALLPPGHWAVGAVQQLDDLGLLPGYLPAQGSVPRERLREALHLAAAAAPSRSPALASLAAGYLTRFDEEFDRKPANPEAAVALEGAAASLQAQAASSRLAPSPARPDLLSPATSVPALVASARLDASLSRYVGVSIAPEATRERVSLPAWEAVVGWRFLSLSVGRAPVRYGLQGERGLVMSGTQALPRVELQSTRPVVLPGPLRYLGPFAFDTFLARLADARHMGRPLLWGSSVRVRPHPRLSLSLHRGVMVGGRSGAGLAKPSELFHLVFATKNLRENNVMGLSGRWRLPTEASLLPLTAYVEWGADDLGAQFKAPGIVAGVRAPVLPGMPSVSLGAEFSFLGAVCCRTFQWYAHFMQQGGWVERDAPLGHPLGGDGREYHVYGSAALLDARLRLSTDLFLRQRFPVNLYGSAREGTAVGVTSSLGFRPVSWGELGVEVAHEGIRTWWVRSAQGRASIYF